MIRRLWPLLLIGYFGLAAVLLFAFRAHWTTRGLAPEQPINFSHVIHVEQLGLECTHCHAYVERSPQATVPALSVCMACHKAAAVDRPEIQKLTRFWEEGRPMEWVRVHTLPWHARFTHERHIKAGVECVTCHGEVRAMARIRRVRSLKMGWCVNCHRSRQAPLDCTTCHK